MPSTMQTSASCNSSKVKPHKNHTCHYWKSKLSNLFQQQEDFLRLSRPFTQTPGIKEEIELFFRSPQASQSILQILGSLACLCARWAPATGVRFWSPWVYCVTDRLRARDPLIHLKFLCRSLCLRSLPTPLLATLSKYVASSAYTLHTIKATAICHKKQWSSSSRPHRSKTPDHSNTLPPKRIDGTTVTIRQDTSSKALLPPIHFIVLCSNTSSSH